MYKGKIGYRHEFRNGGEIRSSPRFAVYKGKIGYRHEFRNGGEIRSSPRFADRFIEKRSKRESSPRFAD